MPALWQVGLVGKPSSGKTTFFVASTLVDAKIAPYPFTTIEPNKGVGYVRVKCVCQEFNVKDNPRNSVCINGYRFIPVEVIDVAGLVPDAWKGRGLGNKFLDELRRANVLIHVVDASGSTDEEGRQVPPGTHDPIIDVKFLEREIDMWIFQMLKKDWDKLCKRASLVGVEKSRILAERLSGLGVKEGHVRKVLEESGLASKKLDSWSEEDIITFVSFVRSEVKPMIIAANKADIPEAVDNIKRMQRELKDYIVVPTCAAAELALRKAAQKGLIRYLPGDTKFEIINEKMLTPKHLKALEYIEERVFKVWGSTGVQEAINRAFLDKLGMIVVFPVENEVKLCDHQGRVLPDAFLVPSGTTAKEFAYLIHTELGEGFISAIDVRTKKKLSADYVLKHRDVIKIISRK